MAKGQVGRSLLGLIDLPKAQIASEPLKGTSTNAAVSGGGMLGNDDNPDDERRVTLATAWVRAQTARDSELGLNAVGDPSWSILLSLFIAHHAHQARSLSALSSDAKSAITTTRRWVALLDTAGFVIGHVRNLDPEQETLSLSDYGIERMNAAIDRAFETNQSLGIQPKRRN